MKRYERLWICFLDDCGGDVVDDGCCCRHHHWCYCYSNGDVSWTICGDGGGDDDDDGDDNGLSQNSFADPCDSSRAHYQKHLDLRLWRNVCPRCCLPTISYHPSSSL